MHDHPTWMGLVFLVAGIFFLLADFGTFDWGISWWTIVFLLFGLHALSKMGK